MNYQGLMEITKIENIADDVYEMTLKGEGAKYISQPGQFINIKINESLQPYLRRPMSISDYDENTIVIVFKVVGQGTEILKNKQIGDQLDCLIGLGNGFTVQEGKALLIGGGLGTPPLYNLGKKLKEQEYHCPLCIEEGNDKTYTLSEMEGNHITPWSEGGN